MNFLALRNGLMEESLSCHELHSLGGAAGLDEVSHGEGHLVFDSRETEIVVIRPIEDGRYFLLLKDLEG